MTTITLQEQEPQLFWVSPEEQSAPIQLAEQSTSVAQDSSGSTAGRIDIEQSRIRNLFLLKGNLKGVAMWGSTCRNGWEHPKKIENYRCDSGTAPQNIPYCDMNQSNVFVMLTDGAISPSTVQSTSNAVAGHLPSTSISIITVDNSLDSRINSIDASVMAPFRDGSENALLLVRCIADRDDEIHGELVFRVLQTKGVFANAWGSPEIQGTSRFEDLQFITMDQILKIQTVAGSSIPRGHASIGSRVVNMDLLCSDYEVSADDLTDILKSPIELVQVAQSSGRLDKLRAKFTRMKTQLLNELEVEVRSRLSEDTFNEFETMNKMCKMDSASAEFKELQTQLREYRVEKFKRDAQFNEEFKLAANKLLQPIESLLAMMTEAKKIRFGLDAYTRLNQTNRVARAVKVQLDSTNDHVPEFKGSYADVSGAECSICCETNTVLVLRVKQLPDSIATMNIQKKNENGSPALGDFIQNFPLAFGAPEHNRVFLPDEPMCVDCAKVYNLSVLTREDVFTTIPLISLNDKHAQFLVLRKISLTIAKGTLMPIWYQLFAAILHYYITNVGFCDEDHEENRSAYKYLLNEILSFTKTNDNLQAGGAQVVLKDAIANVIGGKTKCVEAPTVDFRDRYPFAGIVFMCSHSNIMDSGKSILHRSILKELAIKHLGSIKNNNDAIPKLLIDCYNQLFKCRYGVPVEETARIPNEETLLALLPDYVIRSLNEWKSSTGNESFVHLPAFVLVWWNLVHVPHHDRVDNCIIKLRKDTLFNTAFNDPASVTSEEVLLLLNNTFRRGALDSVHNCHTILNNGIPWPSVLECMDCGHRFAPSNLNQSYEKITEHIRTERSAHFQEIFHANSNGNPDNFSLHYNGYSAIQQTYNPKLGIQTNTTNAIKHVLLIDQRGFINKEDIEVFMEQAVISFAKNYDVYVKCNDEYENVGLGHAEYGMSLEFKVRKEMEFRNWS